MNLATVKRELREIPLGLLDPPRTQSRIDPDGADTLELAHDIRAKGLISPLIVARMGERYEIVAGHRRSIACRKAGLVAVECLVYPTYETALIGVQYSENRFRRDLTAAEEAILFADYLDTVCGGDVDQVCALFGESRSYVEHRINLRLGCEHVFAALLEDKIKLGVAQKLNEISDTNFRRYYLDAAIRGGATVAVVAGWVQQWKQDVGVLPPSPPAGTVVAAPSPVPQTNYFTCICCGGTDNVHLMQPVNVHAHCKLAILDKLIAVYRGESS